ncbi:MAG: endopeptidase La [Muribaculaceae bacterium]|nr:endopeptidase La [Muribaculaceae bacterium]
MARKKSDKPTSDPNVFPILDLKDNVVFPILPQPVKVEDDMISTLMDGNSSRNIDVFVRWKSEPDLPSDKQSLKLGVVCRIDKVMHLPGAPAIVFLSPLFKGYASEFFTKGKITYVDTITYPQIKAPARISKEGKYMLEQISRHFDMLTEYLQEIDNKNAHEIASTYSNDHVTRLYAMAHVAPLTLEEKYRILQPVDFEELVETTLTVFDMALQRIHFQASIHDRTHQELSKQQKENILRSQMRQIKEELGETDENEDISDLMGRSVNIKWSRETAEHFKKEVGKLRRLNISNPEYSVQYSYLDTLLSLPWQNYVENDFSLKKVEDILNRDHFGLEKVKERIVEQMAVIKLRNDLKSPILCLYGPPGVGKTSIGKSVAEALGKEYVRISLGGMHDEAEIRGHRKTYIGAMPGRFIQSLMKCKTGNPLVLLDEIDKVGKDYKGDPSSALLEALDPEQNSTFHDNFIDYPYDLSKILFIATANDLSTIPAPLRDRMEVIELSGYIPVEKREIALRHLVNKALLNTGFKPKEIKFTPEAIDTIIRYYTREAGVRQLEKKITKILRKIARLNVLGEKYPKKISAKIAETYLGKHEYNPDSFENTELPGVATGLAWTPVGGDILFIESSLSPGKGEKLAITGNLGDVMKESAAIALQYLKAHASELGIPQENFSKFDVHIHVPEGAVPKDGPSAGITIATSLASAYLNKIVDPHTAMTGEMTLRGKVLPVGGIKEKIIAAKLAGIKRIILSHENRKDIEEIAPQYLEGLEFIYVKTLSDVLSQAFI